MIEQIVDARFWIGGVLLVVQAGVFTVAAIRNRRLVGSSRDASTVRDEQLRLVFGAACIVFFVSGVMATVVLLTMIEMDGAGLLPGILVGLVTGAVLAAWNPWLRRLDVSSDESGSLAAFKAAASDLYPAGLPIILVLPFVATATYLLRARDWDPVAIGALGFATFSTLITTMLFCLSAVAVVVLLRYSRGIKKTVSGVDAPNQSRQVHRTNRRATLATCGPAVETLTILDNRRQRGVERPASGRRDADVGVEQDPDPSLVDVWSGRRNPPARHYGWLTASACCCWPR